MVRTMTSKGQVTVPKSLRDRLGLKPGAAVEFALGPTGEVVVRAARPGRARRRGSGRFGKLRGTLETGMTTEELMQLLRGYGEDAGDPGLR
jgi:AbrB family looped-hinge helix DNA binding protein